MLGGRSDRRTQLGVGLVLAGTALAVVSALQLRRRRRAKGTSMADAKERVRRLFEEPWKGNWDVLDELVAPEYLGYDSGQAEPLRGADSLRAYLKAYSDAFPDARLTVHEQVAEPGKVATRWTARGTHAGEISGIAATGKEVTVSGLTISTLAGGKISEQWTTWDRLGMLVQLGAVPTPAEA